MKLVTILRNLLSVACVLSTAFGAERTLHREDVLGTSLDCQVMAPTEADAQRAIEAIVRRFGELEGELSRYRKDSALSELNSHQRSLGLSTLPESLQHLLTEGLAWHHRSKGVFYPCREPLLDPVSGQLMPPYLIEGGRLKRRAVPIIDLDGIAKGYIIDQAAAAARAASPSVSGLLINCGGDIVVRGRPSADALWSVAVADPNHAADNADPLVTLKLRDRAVASSGNYERGPHLMDPSTGRASDVIAGATVVAADAETADVLATICAIGRPAESIALVDGVAGAACIIVDTSGTRHASVAWEKLVRGERLPEPLAVAGGWKDGHEVVVDFTLEDSSPAWRKFHRHYVAVWIDDAEGKHVATLGVWARRNELKYVKKLKTFWNKSWVPREGNSYKAISRISKATRKAGHYQLVWDGTNSEGDRMPPGEYTVHLEIVREKGPPSGKEFPAHVALKLICGKVEAKAAAKDQTELKDVRVRYGAK